MPLYIGYNVQFIGIKKGSIVLNANRPGRGSVRIGMSLFPQFPTKRVSTMIRLSNGSKVEFGDNVEIGKGCSIVGSYNGQIVFGEDVFMNMHSMIYSNNSVKIEDHVSLGWYAQIYDSSVHYLVDVKTGVVKTASKSILISNNVWIANHVTIAPGAKIPPFTTVASHSLVNRNFLGNTDMGGLLVGIPALYKPMGKVRILNDSVQHEIKSRFTAFRDIEELTIGSLGYDQMPIDAKTNSIYRRK